MPAMHPARMAKAVTMVVRLWSMRKAMVRLTKRWTGEFMTLFPAGLFVALSRAGSQLLAQMGTCTSAKTQLASRLTQRTKNRSPAYSPAESGER